MQTFNRQTTGVDNHEHELATPVLTGNDNEELLAEPEKNRNKPRCYILNGLDRSRMRALLLLRTNCALRITALFHLTIDNCLSPQKLNLLNELSPSSPQASSVKIKSDTIRELGSTAAAAAVVGWQLQETRADRKKAQNV